MSPLPAVLRLLWAWIAGIVVSELCRVTGLDVWVVSVAGMSVAGIFSFVALVGKSSSRWRRRVQSAGWQGAALLCSLFSLACWKARTDLPECPPYTERGRFEVEVLSEGTPRTRSVAYCVEERSTQRQYMLYWNGEGELPLATTVVLDGVRFPLSDSIAYHLYLYRQGYSGTMYARHAVVFAGEAESSFGGRMRCRALECRQWCLRQIDSHGPSADVRSLIRGCLLGDKRDFDPEVLEHFSYAGMTHLLVVSGLHVGILFAILWVLLAPLRWAGCRGGVRVLSLLLLWAYVAMIGFPASAVRAAVMFSMIHVAALLRRDAFGWHTWGAAALFLLLYDTQWLWSLSFQMSFLAVAAILAVRPELDAIACWRLSRSAFRVGTVTAVMRWQRFGAACVAWPGSALLVSMAAQCGILPLSLHYFHHLPCLGVVQAVVVLPLIGIYLLFLILLLLFHAVLSVFSPVGMAVISGLTAGCWYVVEAISRWILAVAEWAHHTDVRLFGDIKWFPDTWEMFGLYAVEIVLLLCWRTKRAAWLIVALSIVAMLLLYGIVLS